MFSLLPAEYKQKLLREYRLRILAVSLVFLFSLTIIAIVFSFPSFIKVKFTRDGYMSESEQIKKSFASENDADIIKSIEDLKLQMSSASLDSRSAVFPIERVTEIKGSDISITGFSYVYAPGGSNFSISGIAQTRKALTTYSKKLSVDKTFKVVDLPLGNLAKDEDVPFTITLSGDF